MGAPPSEDQMADLLSNPAVAQSMNEALNNPAFVDMVIQTNPALANMPNARELINSPQFRSMMTNPEHIRMAARMRRMMGGAAAGQSSFPAPGATDTTPAGAPAAGEGNNTQPPGPLAAVDPLGAMANPFAAAGNPFAFGGVGGNPFAALFGGNPMGVPPADPTTGEAVQNTAAAGNAVGGTTTGSNDTTAGAAANPFAALFGGAGAGAGAEASPFGGVPPELLRQYMNMGMPSTPADTRPPEERYAEQLRQLNDMGFYDFDRNVRALQRAGGSVQGAIEQLVNDTM